MKNLQNTKNSLLKPALFLLSVLIFSLTGPLKASPLQNTNPVPRILSDQPEQTNTKDTVYSFAEKMPEFPGGEKEVVKFLNKTMHYPEAAQKKDEHGKVIVQFVISKTGKVENAKVLKSVSPYLDAEALRVIGLLPDWTPGEQNGEKVAVYRIIPILFQNMSPEDAWDVNEKTMVVIDNVKMPSNFNPTILNFDKFGSATILKPFPEKEKSKLMSKYGKQAENGVILLTTNKKEIQFALPDSTMTTLKNDYSNCKENAVLPVFPGGEAKLLTYIADSIQYPFVAKRLKTQGKVLVQFSVDTAGKVGNAKVVRSVDYFLNKEALRVISSMPDWIPGTLCDKKLNFIVTVPVAFKLELPANEQKEWTKNDKTVVMLDGVRLPSSFKLEWLKYENLTSYKVLEPTSKEVIKKLVSQYGREASNGVILIGSRK